MNSPANNEAAVMYTNNYPEYESRVRQCVENSCLDDDGDMQMEWNYSESLFTFAKVSLSHKMIAVERAQGEALPILTKSHLIH